MCAMPYFFGGGLALEINQNKAGFAVFLVASQVLTPQSCKEQGARIKKEGGMQGPYEPGQMAEGPAG